MKKILLVAPLSPGHLQKWIKPFLNEYEFIFFTLHDVDLPEEYARFTKYKMPSITGTRFDFILAWPYLQLVSIKHSPDVIYASFLSSYGLLVALLFSNSKKYLSAWGTDVNGMKNKKYFFKFIVRSLINKFDWVNAPAKHMKFKLVKLGLDQKKIDVFQYGVDTSFLQEKKIKLSSEREKGEIKFISIRNWAKLYNIESIIKGYSHFCNHSELPSQLTIVGKGTVLEERDILSLIDSLSFQNGEVNLIGFVDKYRLNSLLIENDVVISVPSMDGTPLSLLEAMYVGLLPIVSKIDANLEWIKNDCGVFTDDHNISFGFDRAKEMFFSSEIGTILNANRQIVLEKADYETNTKKLKLKFDSSDI